MNNFLLKFLVLTTALTLGSCSKSETAAVSSNEPVKKDGNQPPSSDGGQDAGGDNNDGDWNQSAGGGGGIDGGYNGNPTKTPTSTAIATFTGTYTITSTPTFTATHTPTASHTATNSPTHSPTNSPTKTFTSTHTPTASHTATNSPTNSPTKTFTATHTPTASHTATNSPTNSPTKTFTSSPTATSTMGIPGCKLPEAQNYNAQATVEDGSCLFKACLDKSFNEYSGENLVSLIENYATINQLNISQMVESTCKTFETKDTTGYCCGCYKPVVTQGMACKKNCSQKFTANPNCYWSYISCDPNRILQAYHSNGFLKFSTYQQVPYCTSLPTKGAIYQYAFGIDYETTLHVKKLARPIAYAPTKLNPGDARLKGKTYLSFKNTIGLMLNADFSIKKFVHGKGKDFTPSASCTVTYEVRGHYKLNNSTGLLELQTPGENITTVDDGKIVVNPSFTQTPFWIRIKKQGASVSCYYQAGNTFPNSWSMMSATPQIVKGWDGQTVLNAIIGPKFQAGIIINAHSLEGIEVYEYKQLNP